MSDSGMTVATAHSGLDKAWPRRENNTLRMPRPRSQPLEGGGEDDFHLTAKEKSAVENVLMRGEAAERHHGSCCVSQASRLLPAAAGRAGAPIVALVPPLVPVVAGRGFVLRKVCTGATRRPAGGFVGSMRSNAHRTDRPTRVPVGCYNAVGLGAAPAFVVRIGALGGHEDTSITPSPPRQDTRTLGLSQPPPGLRRKLCSLPRGIEHKL